MARCAVLCLVMALAGCAHRSEVKAEESVQEKADSSRAVDTVTETHTEQGHKRITTYEFGPLPETGTGTAAPSDGKPQPLAANPGIEPRTSGPTPRGSLPASRSGALPSELEGHSGTMPEHGPLVKMTVEDDDPSSASSLTKIKEREKAEADRLAKEKMRAASSSKPQLPGCGISGGIWGVAIGLGFLVVFYVLWKLKKLPFIG